MTSAAISVVIPTLDEEARVVGAIASVRGDATVIVVDGGSRDGTREVAAAAGAEVVRAPRGRGIQLQVGARQAAGDWLVFLHADTRLEAGWAQAIRALRPDVPGGAFRFALDSRRPAYRLIEAGVSLRCRVLCLPYGDQALFARREAYEIIGGFAPLPSLEDVDFVRRLRRIGPLAFLSHRAITSPRRWEAEGLRATSLRNLRFLALYSLGFPLDRLAAIEGRSIRALEGRLRAAPPRGIGRSRT